MFNRICQLTIDVDNNKEFIFDEKFRITFDIQKNISETPKTSTFTIYNLSQSTRDKLSSLIMTNNGRIKSGSPHYKLQLSVGYKDDNSLGIIYRGVMSSVYSKKENGNVMTIINCADNSVILNNTYAALSYNSGIKLDAMLKDVADKAKVEIDASSNTTTSNTLTKGFSFVGNTSEALDKIIKQEQLKWTTDNGSIKVLSSSGSSKEYTIVLNAESGLIGSPERIESSGEDSDTSEPKSGWKVKSLLSSLFTLGRNIRIDSSTLKGTFVIQSVTHKGDTMGSDWTSELELA